MKQAITIGLDIAKHVFQAHGADAAGHVLFRKRLTRAKLLGFLAAQAPCVVAMEACAGSHYWGREISKLGHTVRLIPPAYVKPFVKRQKNDAADAEAICEAAQRPSMRFVPVKDEEQQANGVVFRALGSSGASAHAMHQCFTRAPLRIRLRLSPGHHPCRNPDRSRRGSEFVFARKCPGHPQAARRYLFRAASADQGTGCRDQPALEGRPGRTAADDDPGRGSDCCHRNHGACAGGGELPSRTRFRRLARADATAEIDRREAETRRHIKAGRADHSPLADPRGQRSDPAACRRAAPAGSWLAQMLPRKPKMLVTVALANKMARVVWALLVKGGVYRAPAAAA